MTSRAHPHPHLPLPPFTGTHRWREVLLEHALAKHVEGKDVAAAAKEGCRRAGGWEGCTRGSPHVCTGAAATPRGALAAARTQAPVWPATQCRPAPVGHAFSCQEQLLQRVGEPREVGERGVCLHCGVHLALTVLRRDGMGAWPCGLERGAFVSHIFITTVP